jgi:hypothetical protein
MPALWPPLQLRSEGYHPVTYDRSQPIVQGTGYPPLRQGNFMRRHFRPAE